MTDNIAEGLSFLATSKKAIQYKFVEDGVPGQMVPFTYTIAKQPTRIITHTKDGKETESVAQPNDIIMSGVSGENYAIPAAKFPKLYQEWLPGIMIPDQTARYVARYKGPERLFTAPWGEDMVIKPGDYLVKDGDKGYYRIAKHEYEQTYEPPGIVGPGAE